jgi:hypothetical protein
MLGWLRRLGGDARSSRHASGSEVRALRHVLQGSDPRFALLLDQLRTTPKIRRERPAPDRLLVGPTSTFENLAFVLEVTRISSAWVPVIEVGSGRVLEFRVSVVRSGFLEALQGRTADGAPWPEPWDVAEPAETYTRAPALVLPSVEELLAAQRRARDELAAWLGVALPRSVTLYPPVGEEAIKARAAVLESTFPHGYRHFLSITDGLELGDLRVLGHDDVYVLDDVGHDGLAIAWDVDDRDDLVVVLARDGRDETVRQMEVHDRTGSEAFLAPDVAGWLRLRLGGPGRRAVER